eukprot:728182-Lingulodinium_polyedra.AAC.1
MPDHVDAALGILDARRWTRTCSPPVRLSAATFPQDGGVGLCPWELELRRSRPQGGQDRYW